MAAKEYLIFKKNVEIRYKIEKIPFDSVDNLKKNCPYLLFQKIACACQQQAKNIYPDPREFNIYSCDLNQLLKVLFIFRDFTSYFCG